MTGGPIARTSHTPWSYAAQQLQKLLAIDPDADPLGNFPNDIQRAQLKRFADLLARNGLKKDRENAGQLHAALEDALSGDGNCTRQSSRSFLTQAGTARAR